nr:hypothetical protein [Desulfuromonadales bacterium]
MARLLRDITQRTGADAAIARRAAPQRRIFPPEAVEPLFIFGNDFSPMAQIAREDKKRWQRQARLARSVQKYTPDMKNTAETKVFD